MPRLASLKLYGLNRVLSLARLPVAAPALRSLKLCLLRGVSSLEPVGRLSGLTRLVLNHLPRCVAPGLAHLRHLHRLEDLLLVDCPGLTDTAALADCSHLCALVSDLPRDQLHALPSDVRRCPANEDEHLGIVGYSEAEYDQESDESGAESDESGTESDESGADSDESGGAE
jgi:hypothetical protein